MIHDHNSDTLIPRVSFSFQYKSFFLERMHVRIVGLDRPTKQKPFYWKWAWIHRILDRDYKYFSFRHLV